MSNIIKKVEFLKSNIRKIYEQRKFQKILASNTHGVLFITAINISHLRTKLIRMTKNQAFLLYPLKKNFDLIYQERI